jgi:Tol biopolymer transport system component/DNA-binding winged helix-turn-helix (wHTH) protein
MSFEINSFRFEEFEIDTKEKTLLQNGKVVSLTPKAFHLLQVLVENHGQLMTRDELMQRVWADSFVEESNLTFTIALLRKALEDNSQNPRFIKTVPLYGYRFIAQVEQISSNNKDLVKTNIEVFDKVRQSSRKSYFYSFAIFAFLLLISGGWYLQKGKMIENLPILSTSFESEKLSTDGKVFHAIISPDGKNVVYTNGLLGKQSVWMREIQTGNNIELIPENDEIYGGLAFSPDGAFFYFTRMSKNTQGQLDIFRSSIFGGIPIKIVSETQGWIGVSPDGSKISFVRCYYQDDENCSLWIADSKDGKNERKIVSRPKPFRIGDNKFSIDGKSIAFATGQSVNQSNEFSLMAVDIESGQERELTSEKFFNIKHIAWLPNNNLLITAAKKPNRNFLIWQINTNTNEAKILTKDSENYSNVSLDKDFKFLVSTKVTSDFRLMIRSFEDVTSKNLLAEGETASFSPNGKIVFSSEKSGNMEIWIAESNGFRQIQLTNDEGDDSKPIVSANNEAIFFASNRSGEVQVWRMNSDGSNQVQITNKDGGFPIFISPDGSRVYYHHGLHRTLWSVSAKGGDEQLVLNEKKIKFAISPDGTQVAFAEKQNENNVLVIFSLVNNVIVNRFKTAIEKSKISDIAWTPNGNNVAYIVSDSKSENNSLWIQKINGEKPQKIADFGEGAISELSSFSISPDGKYYTVSNGNWLHDAVLLKGLK